MPIDDPRTDWLAFDAGVKRENTETARQRQLADRRAALDASRHDWFRMTMLSFLIEDFTVGARAGARSS